MLPNLKATAVKLSKALVPYCVKSVAALAAQLESCGMNERDQERLLNEMNARKARTYRYSEQLFSWSMILALALVTVCIGVGLSTTGY